MATDVEIASRALVALGANAITSFGDGTTEANVANQFFLPTLDYLLGLHRWNFCWKQAELVEDVPAGESSPGPYDDPIYVDFGFAYDKPADLIRIDKVLYAGLAIAWQEKGDQIASDWPPTLVIEYNYRPTITTLPAFFLVPLEHLLAARMAVPITQKDRLLSAYNALFMDALRLARNVDAQQSTAERMPLGRLNRARAGRVSTS